jgi:phosphatidylinositol alpha-1,6-mannosyltransferase
MALKIAIPTCEFLPYPGGIATYTSELASAALALGHVPTVIAPGCPPDRRAATDYDVRYVFPPVYSHRKLPSIARTLRSELKRARFDCVLAADLPSLLAAYPLRIKARAICALHGTDAKSRLIGYINRFTPFRPFHAFDKIVCNSEFTKQLLLKHNSYVPADKVHVAPLGVGSFWFERVAPATVALLDQRFSLSPNRKLLLSAGRLEPRKGVVQAVKAIAQLPDDLRHALTYLIVGRPVEQDYVRQLNELAQSVDADIRIVGQVAREDLRSLYHRADLFLHTATRDQYRAEGFGLVLLEAAVCGAPVLATRVDAIPEVLAADAMGCLVEDGDATGISHAIAGILRDAARPNVAARKAYASQFTWRRCAEITFG